MQKRSVMLIVLCLAVGAGIWASVRVQARAAGQAATGKVDSQWKCAAPSPIHVLPVGDAANHAYAIQQVKCVAAKGEVAGVKEQTGASTEFAEITGDNAKGHGVFIAMLASGDRVTYTYTFSGVSSKNVLLSGSNEWTITEGSGKLKGITGKGTCKGKGNADGSAVFDCAGTYAMPK